MMIEFIVVDTGLPPQADPKTALIRQIDIDVDAIYAAAVGNRGPEYDQAALDAQSYAAAGYAGTVPASVASWATAKGWTAQAAADDILLAAGRLAAARDAIRAQRLLRKEQARNASDDAALAAVAGAWSGFVATIRTQLGV